MMNILIAGGTGFIGRYLIKGYLKHQHTVTVIGRSTEKIRATFPSAVRAVNWSALTTELIKKQDLIINLCGEGIADKRWTAERKQLLLDSRLIPTQSLVKCCAELGERSPPLFNASAIGFYGTQNPGDQNALDESSPANPNQFASQLVQQWEAATQPAIDAGVRVVLLRFGVVLGPEGGALARLKLAFNACLGGKIGSGKQPFSWVSILDLARAIDFLYQNTNIQGPVNIVSPNNIQQEAFASALSKALHRPALMPTPAFALKLLFGQMAEELLLDGQRVYPNLLINNHFNFKAATIKEGLQYALRKSVDP